MSNSNTTSMKTYRVEITEQRTRFVRVKADSWEQASSKAVYQSNPEDITEPYPPEIVGMKIGCVDDD